MEQSRQPLPKSIIAFIILLVAVFSVALIYFIFVRVQDGDYDKAVAQIDTMTANASAISKLGETADLDPATVQQTSLDEAKQAASAYIEAFNQLKQSSAVTRDKEVEKAYVDNKGVIEEYGRSTANMFATLETYAHIKQSCNKLLAKVSSITTLAEFEEESKTCQEYVDKNTNVPQDDFNENYFQKYRGYLGDLLDSLHAYYTAGEADNNSQMRNAQTSITKALTNVGDLNESGDYPIANSENPKDALVKIKTVLQNRKSVTIR